MSKLETIVSKWDFRRIARVFCAAALVLIVCCAVAVGIVFRERLVYAMEFMRLEEAAEGKNKDPEAKRQAMDKVAAASSDVVDILAIDGDGKVWYSAKQSPFTADTFTLAKIGDEKRYYAAAEYPDAVFQYVKGEAFMLRSVLSEDFGKLQTEYAEEGSLGTGKPTGTFYMLTRLRCEDTSTYIYVISTPTSVPGGALLLKGCAALAVLLFSVYWVLVALWLYRDASRARLPAVTWGLIGLATNIVGVLVYCLYKKGNALCPECGAVQANGHGYCVYCGAQIGKRCPGCGGRVLDTDRYCHHCGAKLPNGASASL